MNKLQHVFCPLIPLIALCTSCHPPKPSEDAVICEAYVHRYGVQLPEDEWSARGENGHIVSLQKDGIVVTRCYDQGVLHGTTTYSFPYRETIQRDEVYDSGVVVEENFFYKSGLPYKQMIFQSPERHSVTCWFENGAPQCREEYCQGSLSSGEYFNPNHQLECKVELGHGQRICRNGHGLLVYTDEISDGQLVQRTSYHPNGTPSAFTPYVDGVIVGQRKTFHLNGEPSTLEEWTNGRQQGWTVTYENGERLSEIQYVNGYKHGIEKRFRDGETLAQEITWTRGRKQGPCYTYLGERKQTDWYFGDRLVNKAQYDVMCQQQ